MSLNQPFFTVIQNAESGAARTGLLHTQHAQIPTPTFMPVGTYGAVKGLMSEDLLTLPGDPPGGAQIILCNAYHLYLRPGPDFMRDFGGLHRFMQWPRAILTDSGGFQIFSLAKLCKISEEGVEFQSHIDGSTHQLTPEKVLEIEDALGVDIAMPLDCFCANPASYDDTKAATERTWRWLKRAAAVRAGKSPRVFGIVQGGTFADLRQWSALKSVELEMDGYSIGGLSVGEAKPAMWEMIEVCNTILPTTKPRYLMGVGTPEDLVEGVTRGVDMFDCVMPTRNARNGTLFTSTGTLVIKNAKYARDEAGIDPNCACFVCKNYSRAYIRYLFKNGELNAMRMLSYHNVFYYLALMKQMRQAISAGGFAAWRKAFYEMRQEPDLEEVAT